MAEIKEVEIIKEHYFFGFAKFFSFSNDEKIPGLAQEGQPNASIKNKMSYVTPIRINSAPNIDRLCVTWASIFHLCKETGKVHAYGWCNGKNITSNENVYLPVDSKVCNLQACWKKMVLISQEGKCHVMTNLHDDWTVSVCENETKFSSCDVGDLHMVILDHNGKAFEIRRENECGSFGYLCSPIHLKVKVDAVSCGKEHVLLLNKRSGHVFSYGLGTRGQLGHGEVNAETTPKLVEALAGICIQQVTAGGWHSLALSDIGDIYAWGWNNCGQLGITCLPPEVPQAFHMLPYIVEFPEECTVVHINCGARHSGAVTSQPKQSVWTWGWGQYGQLGHGDSRDRTTPSAVEYFKDIDAQILEINCGPWQTIVIIERINNSK